MPKLHRLIMIAILASLVNFNCAYTKQLQNDPTMPKNLEGISEGYEDLNKKANQGGNLVLTAILISPGNNTAIINDQILHEKDQIAKYEIVKIESNKVVLKTIVNHEENISESEIETATKEKTIEIKLPAISIKE